MKNLLLAIVLSLAVFLGAMAIMVIIENSHNDRWIYKPAPIPSCRDEKSLNEYKAYVEWNEEKGKAIMENLDKALPDRDVGKDMRYAYKLGAYYGYMSAQIQVKFLRGERDSCYTKHGITIPEDE